MAKIRKGDTVQVIAGKDKGQTGKVLSVDANRILIEGVNRVSKHTKETTGDRGAKVGGILHVERPIHFKCHGCWR
jgi:large subunit ribosomal protein L24